MRNKTCPIFKGKSLKKLKRYNKYQGYPIIIRSKQIKIKAKGKYKDSVFTKLFNNKATAIQLYNALFGKNLPSDTPVEIVTLDDVLFTKRKNDVAFIVDGHFLIFVEHQSTVNENMPLRLLLYVAQEYEKICGYRIIKGKQVSNLLLYRGEQIKIPKPEFFVLYNGKEDLTEITEDGTVVKVIEKTMKLSDAFIENSNNSNSLELCVNLIDVRYNTNHVSLYQTLSKDKKIEENLNILGEYSYFINKIEEYKNQKNSLEEAIKTAAKYCIQKGILKEFLLKNETEVITMLIGTYDEEIEKQVLCEEAEAKGIRIGRAEGIRTLIDFTLDLGYSNEEILSILQKKLSINLKQAEDYLGRFYKGTL